MKVYISGPVRGYRERFQEAENVLVAAGNTVINPVRVNAELPKETTYEEYMKMSIAMLDMCDVIFALKGWQNSRGCNREIARAMQQGITITFEGERGCLESQNKQGQENSVKMSVKQYVKEIKERAFSVK